ncbi:ArsR/SmtB family transcription factor [Actinomadura sediminis]|uniref:ArsR/SmtB family transcription factor n=1 Tax=Actinomadura sediminis TaxID=1038904 RepID=A0ABW3EKZ7_9ACTN
MEDELEERLARLERRVDRLEGRDEPAAAPLDGDVFWALNELKVRVSEPGAVLFTGTVDLPTGEHYEWQEGRTADELLDIDWSDLAPALAALSHPVRLLLLQEILRGARTTAELGRHERLGTTGQLYHHLRALVTAGWLRAGARGRYAVPGERVVPLLAVLAAVHR